MIVISRAECNSVCPFARRFIEETTPHLALKMRLNKVLFDQKSDFQRAQIIETAQFGRTLVLDGKTQSAQSDEHVYHESLVHPAMMLHGSPKRVFIGGGGEMATAREVLRHKSVEKCVMVDIDEVVCKICMEQLPEWHGGCLEDPRLELKFEDARAALEASEEKYDVIIMDIADPIEAGPGIALYFKEFYEFAKTRMNPGGVIVTQSGPGSVMNADECFSTIHQTLRGAFDLVVPYSSDIPSFATNWAFNVAFDLDSESGKAMAKALEEGKAPAGGVKAGAGDRPTVDQVTAAALRAHGDFAAVDEKLGGMLNGGMDSLKFLDGVALSGVLGLPRGVRKVLQEETRVMTKESPVFMY